MRVLLCCAGGLSSSILMKKMKAYAESHGEELDIIAVGTGEAVEQWNEGWDCVLVAPQASYRMNDMKQTIQIPMASVPSLEYAIGDAEKVLKLAHEISGK
ncbi:MAG: PTS sugar transporter subunit IIB [Oscillospiraceae bacterium]|nr:PTS sugar transporter subunit IIB [Oscillospiraceae bacterium]